MSITRSYNKYTDTYYAYETTYEWDSQAQKKVQRKKCIGKYDPLTGEIIPTGKRGRPLKQPTPQSDASVGEGTNPNLEELLSKAHELSSRLDAIDTLLAQAVQDVRLLRQHTDALIQQLQPEE